MYQLETRGSGAALGAETILSICESSMVTRATIGSI